MHLHKLMVGAGNKISVGWVHNDIQELPGIQLVGDCRELNLDDETCMIVQAEHILEHLEEPRVALREWRRVLVDDGMLVLAMPDLETIIEMWRAGMLGWRDVITNVYGQARIPASTPPRLRAILEEAWPPSDKGSAWEALMAQIYGLPYEYEGQPNAHRWGFCKEYLVALLEECGFYHIHAWGDLTALAAFAYRKPAC